MLLAFSPQLSALFDRPVVSRIGEAGGW